MYKSFRIRKKCDQSDFDGGMIVGAVVSGDFNTQQFEFKESGAITQTSISAVYNSTVIL